MTHTKILTMIENVSPDDIKALDEIDWRVYMFKDGCEFKSVKEHAHNAGYHHAMGGALYVPRKYTRSRDALKAIENTDWRMDIIYNEAGQIQIGYTKTPFYNTDPRVQSPFLDTFELAQLYCIMSIKAHERKENDHGK